MKKGSWKTTSAGIAAIIVAIGAAYEAHRDGDPATEPDWGTAVATGAGAIAPFIPYGLGAVGAIGLVEIGRAVARGLAAKKIAAAVKENSGGAA